MNNLNYTTVMCFHLGMTAGFLLDKGTDKERRLDEQECQEVLQSIHHEFVKVTGCSFTHIMRTSYISVTSHLHLT